jgi:CheY-like chemotaxis protein
LIVDGVPVECSACYNFLKPYKLYNVTCVSSVQEANALLMSRKRFHVCLIELDICDINNDGFYLLKTYSSNLPFIVMTDKESLKLGFEIRKLGAFDALTKPLHLHDLSLIQVINEAILYSIFKFEMAGSYKPVIVDAMEVFFKTKPKNLRRWMELLRIDERYFRRVWKDCFGVSPRMVLMVYHAFLDGFDYFNRELLIELKLPENPETPQIADGKNDDKRAKNIYQKHQKEIVDMLKG